MKNEPATEAPPVWFSLVAIACAGVCGNSITVGQETLSDVHITWDAGLRPPILSKVMAKVAGSGS